MDIVEEQISRLRLVLLQHHEQGGVTLFSAGGSWECNVPGKDYVSVLGRFATMP
jgi:hypothetical protein